MQCNRIRNEHGIVLKVIPRKLFRDHSLDVTPGNISLNTLENNLNFWEKSRTFKKIRPRRMSTTDDIDFTLWYTGL